MKNKIGRNELCPCGSGKKYKKCCMKKTESSLPISSWLEEDGLHYIMPGTSPSSEELEKMTKEYQKQIRSSPIWDEMVQQFGEKEAEKMLKEFRAKLK